MMAQAVNAGARLDRLPLGRFHRRLLTLIALGMFFDSFDNAMMASVLAALVGHGDSTVALNARYISVSFLGLTIGDIFPEARHCQHAGFRGSPHVTGAFHEQHRW